ncbi:MAG: C-GCAxxG-C-C family (seleno)protein [Halodesulfurarchaeum sp.]
MRVSTIDVESIDREALERKTKEMGADYADRYVGCAQSSFSTVVDVLREEVGYELVDRETEDAMFAGHVGLAGGVAACGRGSCGAVEGSGFALSLAAGVGRAEQEAGGAESRMDAYDAVYRYVADRALEEFDGLTCREVQWAKFDRAWNMSGPLPSTEGIDPGAFEDFRAHECEACKDDDGHIKPEKCVIPQIAWWAVDGILEMAAESDDRSR